jgi:hypothetical protein
MANKDKVDRVVAKTAPAPAKKERDTKGLVAQVHKQYSYKNAAGKVITVPGHTEWVKPPVKKEKKS